MTIPDHVREKICSFYPYWMHLFAITVVLFVLLLLSIPFISGGSAEVIAIVDAIVLTTTLVGLLAVFYLCS